MAGTAVVAAWLIITVGVAFLREAKALRRARAALEANNAAGAYDWITPFVASHPAHVEALYLAGIAAIMTDRPQEANQHYSKLRSMGENEDAMERVNQLEATFHDQIPVNAARLECGKSPYEAFYANYEILGEKFFDTLIRSGSGVVHRCATSQGSGVANEPGYWLINEKHYEAEFIVSTLYLEPLKPALEQGQYQLARGLAEQGMSLWPEARVQVDEMLSQIRSQSAKHVEQFLALCSSVGKNPEFRQGRSMCFPASPPAAVSAHRDPWGNPLIYTPLSPTKNSECHQGFTLFSLGADGRQTRKDKGTPALDLECRYQWGRPHLQDRVHRFWLP